MMDAFTPLLILAAKIAADKAQQGKGISASAGSQIGSTLRLAGGLIGTGSLLSVACLPSISLGMACAANGLKLGSFIGKIDTTDKKTEDKSEKSVVTTAESPACQTNGVDEKLVEAVVERVKAELPALLETLNSTPSRAIVSETYDTVYRFQIAAAQEFLNENRSADLSRVKCLLHKLLPKEYFEYIEQLREHQDTQTIINIMGGQNIVAPKAKSATQTLCGEKAQKKGS